MIESEKFLGSIGTGKRGEEIAVKYLKKAGYKIIECNYRCLFGEIDIIAKDKKTIVFVEVKTRKSEKFGDPQLSVGFEKQKKISRISLNYIEEKRLHDCDARFDVVAVKMLPEGNKIELIQNAFDLVI
ncbi:MAG: YraN family protein [Syntrophales bacterium]